MQFKTPARSFAFALSAVGAVGTFVGPQAWARPEGIASDDCGGCHEGAKEATVKLMSSTATPAFDQTVRFSVSIESALAKRGGLFLEAMSAAATPAPVGKLTLVPGQGTKFIDMGVTHDGVPKTAVNGKVTFDVDWVAPKTKSSVVVTVSAIGGNMAEKEHGDAFGRARLAFAVGCGAGTDYWKDADGDGFAADDALVVKACDPAMGIATKKGDCDDNNKMTSPSGVEVCNEFDDNCDGKTDEGLPLVAIYRDNDGDGFGAGSETKMGCGKESGWGVGNRDCNDKDAAINPSAKEMCNGKDDDCDSQIDDGALPTCGVGFCVRNAPSCDTASSCKPGAPRPEKCNYADDDCDGTVDNGDICPSGEKCVEGECKAGGGGGESGGAGGEGGAGGSDAPDKSNGGGGCQFGGGRTSPLALASVLGAIAVALRRRRRAS